MATTKGSKIVPVRMTDEMLVRIDMACMAEAEGRSTSRSEWIRESVARRLDRINRGIEKIKPLQSRPVGRGRRL